MNRAHRMRTIAAVLMLIVACSLGAAQTEKPPAGQGKYLIVLWEPGTPVPGKKDERIKKAPEPDVEKLGGRVLAAQSNRRLVFLPNGIARQLRKHAAVSFVQRIWTGEPLSEWNETEAGETLRGDVAADADPAFTWSKSYGYDADGNISGIGNDEFEYDDLGRLTSATVDGASQSYTYDAFGNLTAISGARAATVSIDPATNRLVGQTYDAAGNLTTRAGRGGYEYDALNMMVEQRPRPGNVRRILYDAADERIGTIIDSQVHRWTIRGFDGQILREFRGYDDGLRFVWSWEQDHIRGEGQLIAGEVTAWRYNDGTTAFTYGGKRHYHLDHLGSVRVTTSQAGNAIAEHDFFPFGAARAKQYQEQLNESSLHTDGMRFAGHWRDFLGYPNAESDEYLDAMHARYYDPHAGRFLSVDPVLDVKKALREPQRWNRYTYVINNPLRFTDPTGREVSLPAACASNIPCKEIRDLRNGLPPELRLYVRATKLKDGRVVLNKNTLNAVRNTMGSANFAALRQVANHKDTVRVSTSESGFLRFDFGTQKLMSDTYKQGGSYMGYALTPNESKLALTFVSVNPTDDPRTAAETLAHELYGHAAGYLMGLPYKHSQVPGQVFGDIQREATENYDSWP